VQGQNEAPYIPQGASPVVTTNVPNIDFQWGSGSVLGGPSEDVIVRFTGSIRSDSTQNISFLATADDGTRLYIDGVLVADDWVNKGGGGTTTNPISFTAGVPKTIELIYYEDGGVANVFLYWDQSGSMDIIPASAFTSQAAPVVRTIGPPRNLTVVDGATATTLTWEAPNTGNTQPERYAISFTTEGQNGWGIATGNVGDANALNTTITINHSLLESLMPSGTVWSFHIRSDNDTLGVYSENSNVVTLKIGKTAEEIAAEQAAEQAAIDAENARLAAIAAEEARLAEIARLAEEARLAEIARLAEEARLAEVARLEAEAAALLAAQQEAARIAAEQEAARQAALAAEAARIAAEQEAARQAAITAEQERLAEIARIAAIKAEQDRIAAELAAKAKADRLAAEAAAKKAEEERIAAELAAKKAEEEARLAEESRLKAEAEARAAEEARLKAEEEARLEAERIAAEKAAEEQREKDRLAEEARLKAEAEAIEAEIKAKELEEEKAAKEEAIAEEEELKEILEDAKDGKELNEEQKEIVVAALVEDLKPGGSISAAQVQASGVSYADLPPATPIELRKDENGNELIITAEVAANIELVQDAGALLEAAFTDPRAALEALGSIGADMTEEEREEATDMVIVTVVATGAAMNAVAAAAGVATGGSTGGGNSGGGSSGANSPGSRGGRKW
jgi:hypothetical protein